MNLPLDAGLRTVTLDDKYDATDGKVYITGTQALVRLPIMQRQRDAAAGLNTGGYISGYRGSPVGGYDQAMWKARRQLQAGHASDGRVAWISHRDGAVDDAQVPSPVVLHCLATTRFCRFRNTTPVHGRASSCKTTAQISRSFCPGLAAVETRACRCRPGACCRLHVPASTDTVWRKRTGFRYRFVAASAANVPLRRSRGCGGTQGCFATVGHHG